MEHAAVAIWFSGGARRACETSMGALKKHHCRHVLWVQRNGCKVSLYPVTVLWKVAGISGLQNWMILMQMKSQDSPEDHTFCCRWNSLPICSISCQKLAMSSQKANLSAASTTDQPHLEVGDSTTKFTSQLWLHLVILQLQTHLNGYKYRHKKFRVINCRWPPHHPLLNITGSHKP